MKHGDDDDMTREPEMVQAYRDTWELGLHSYLTYLRDRLLLARELLASERAAFSSRSATRTYTMSARSWTRCSGRRISYALITFKKTTGSTINADSHPRADYLLWYARDNDRAEISDSCTP